MEGMEFVQSLENLLITPQSMTMLLAPPAWGKTSILLKLRERWQGHIIYISPLRALALEFADRMEKEGKLLFPKTRKELQSNQKSFFQKKEGLMIVTAEVLSDSFFDFAKEKSNNIIIVFDEIHLFFHWGKSFRPWLEELLYLAVNSEISLLGLTATLDKEYLKRLESDFLLGLEKIFIIDLGNGKLIYKPLKVLNYRMRGKKALVKRLRNELSIQEVSQETFLVFCQFRAEVEFWIKWSKRLKINALGCVGGETDLFQLELKSNPRPDIIFTTTALSHGVNLPAISKIFLLYPIERRDFWVQMVGRGGRNGEEYNLYHMEKTTSFILLLISNCQSLGDDVLFLFRSYFGDAWKPKLKA